MRQFTSVVQHFFCSEIAQKNTAISIEHVHSRDDKLTNLLAGCNQTN